MTEFVISDHHFGHENILKFGRIDGTPVRPEFSSVEHMNEEMIRRHNQVVGKNDKVYFLGDVAFKATDLHAVMPRLNGRKVLILGNHDKLRMDDYYKYFKSIYSARYRKDLGPDGVMLCHYPLHIDANYPNSPICVHGHIHEKEITTEIYCDLGQIGPTKKTVPDARYFNVSVERIDYTPISFDYLLARIKERKERY
jgi:calcineurin-like phosphoesterase family protein